MLEPTSAFTRRTVRRLLGTHEKLSPALRGAILGLGDEAIDALLEILRPGQGWAAIHAATLLGELRAARAIEPMIDLLAETDWADILHDRIIVALPKMGAAVVEPVLSAMSETDDEEVWFDLAPALAESGVHDERIFAKVVELLTIDPDRAASLFADYGDPRGLVCLARAFDTWWLEHDLHPLANSALVELRAAIEKMGGALTSAQQRKYEAAMVPRERWRRAVSDECPSGAARPGRNAPCWCGSGAKYKRCHFERDGAATPSG